MLIFIICIIVVVCLSFTLHFLDLGINSWRRLIVIILLVTISVGSFIYLVVFGSNAMYYRKQFLDTYEKGQMKYQIMVLKEDTHYTLDGLMEDSTVMNDIYNFQNINENLFRFQHSVEKWGIFSPYPKNVLELKPIGT